MKPKTNSSSASSSKPKSQVELPQSFRQTSNENLQRQYITPKKNLKQKIFVQTPQAIYIPIPQKNQMQIDQFFYKQQQKEQLNHQDQNQKPKKISIFNQKIFQNKKNEPSISTLKLQRQALNVNQILKSKTTVSFKKQRISHFFYHQNFVVCKGLRKIIVYNFFNKAIAHIPINYDQFVLTHFPPYVFNCITGQYLNLYSEQAVQKYTQIQRKKLQSIKRKQLLRQSNKTNDFKKKQQIDDKFNDQFSLNNSIQVIVIKISKLEVQCICRFGQSLYMGGYNRSILPGGKKSQRRQVYLLDNLDPKINNKPKQIIKIEPSSFPISFISVQQPYLVTYCKPTFYVFNLKSHELLLKFQKQMKNCFLLQGRYALNVINGIGISSKDNKNNIFTFDIQNMPIYGVQITQHKQQASCLCLQKTGRIFGCHKSALFEYIPSKRITRCLKIYSQGQIILWIQSTSNNNLLVLRQTQNLEYVIEAFSIDENSICQY